MKDKLTANDPMDQGLPVVYHLVLNNIFSVSDHSLRYIVSCINKVNMGEFAGEDISQTEKFLCGAYCVLKNCDWYSPGIISILFTILKADYYNKFINHVGTIESNYELNLLTGLDVESFLDNFEQAYISA